jgi:hypothetical protein
MNKQSVPPLGMGSLLNKNVFVGAKTLWAARVSNPARRIKSFDGRRVVWSVQF